MDINNKRNRNELKSYFVTNAVPTESQFGDLIDAGLNQREDGIAKQTGSPLAIEAVGDDSKKKVLSLYRSFDDVNPEWTLGMPLLKGQDGEPDRAGLSIASNGGESRLYIDRDSGNVGVGTIEPAASLHVAGDLRVDGRLHVSSGIPILESDSVHITGSATAPPKDIVGTRDTRLFSHPVSSAVVVIQSFDIGYNKDINFMKVGINPTCTVNGNKVTVSVKARLKPNISLDDWTIHLDAYFLVLAWLDTSA